MLSFLLLTFILSLGHCLPHSLQEENIKGLSTYPATSQHELVKRQYYQTAYNAPQYPYNPYAQPQSWYPPTQGLPSNGPVLRLPTFQENSITPSFNPCSDPNSIKFPVNCNGGQFHHSISINGGFSTSQEEGDFTTWKYGDSKMPFTQPFASLGHPFGISTDVNNNNNNNNNNDCVNGVDSNGDPCGNNNNNNNNNDCVNGVDSNGDPCGNNNSNNNNNNNDCVNGVDSNGDPCGNSNSSSDCVNGTDSNGDPCTTNNSNSNNNNGGLTSGFLATARRANPSLKNLNNHLGGSSLLSPIANVNPNAPVAPKVVPIVNVLSGNTKNGHNI